MLKNVTIMGDPGALKLMCVSSNNGTKASPVRVIILISFRAWLLDKHGQFFGPPTLYLSTFQPFSDFKATVLVLDCIKQFASWN